MFVGGSINFWTRRDVSACQVEALVELNDLQTGLFGNYRERGILHLSKSGFLHLHEASVVPVEKLV